MPSDWYRDAVVYELHVRAFQDSDGDGIGDFRGLRSRIGYLQDLGVTAVWLLPFYPSPLRDDGYDIADYLAVHPSYGTLRDVRTFIREAQRAGIRVITELVLNHTSDQHAWFRRARRAGPGTAARSRYVWSDSPDRYADAPVIFRDFEPSNWSWDPDAGAYYWHRFYAHQPDLNIDSPDVRRALLRAVDFWFRMGVDGMRLDAVPYLYERDGTTCENLPETHAFLRELRRHVDGGFDGRMLLAEANLWPEDAVAYFGAGDECHMAFHFPLMPRLFMALQGEDRLPIVDILAQTPSIPDGCQWGLFLRNHDELTLATVTDEERDAMYRAYASDPQARVNLGIRRRLAPLVEGDRRRVELLLGLLFSLPGTPFLYYGDEIGMGDNIYLGDRNGVRTPMQWTAGRNAGFSSADAQRLYLPLVTDPAYRHETVNIESQLADPGSLLWWTKRLVAHRTKRAAVFGRGSIELVSPANRQVLAFVRRFGAESVLVVANLSRHVQHAELDLSAHRGRVPVELFGGADLRVVGEGAYPVTLGPYGFYWLSLQDRRERLVVRPPPRIVVGGPWQGVFDRPTRGALEDAIARWLPAQPWFRASRPVRSVSVEWRESVGDAVMAGVGVAVDPHVTWLVPLVRAAGEVADAQVIARVHSAEGEGVIVDGAADPQLAESLFRLVERARGPASQAPAVRASQSQAVRASQMPSLRASQTHAFREVVRRGTPGATPLTPTASLSSSVFGDSFVLKLERRVEAGSSPEAELGLALSGFDGVPALAGVVSRAADGATLAVLHRFIPDTGTARDFVMDAVVRFLDRALASGDAPPGAAAAPLDGAEPPQSIREIAADALSFAELFGSRVADLHRALAAVDEPSFVPEPITDADRRSLYQSMRTRVSRMVAAVAAPDGLDSAIDARLRRLLTTRLNASRIRLHGDLHLGHVLKGAGDVTIIDLGGDETRSASERRLRRTATIDVARAARSLCTTAFEALAGGRQAPPGDASLLAAWTGVWTSWVSSAFLRSYVASARGAVFLPSDDAELDVLLECSLLDRAVADVAERADAHPDELAGALGRLAELVDAPA